MTTLRGVLRLRYALLLAFAATVGLAFWLYRTLPQGFHSRR